MCFYKSIFLKKKKTTIIALKKLIFNIEFPTGNQKII